MPVTASWADVPCVYSAALYPSGASAAGLRILIEAIAFVVADNTLAIPDPVTVTLNETGQIDDGFTLPSVGDGVYYRITERFVGGRPAFTILVLPTDTQINLATAAPQVPPEDLEDTRGPPGADGVVQSIVAGGGISVDNTDPANPVVSATGDAAITNAAVNTAIEEDAAATRTALGLGTAAAADTTDFDAAGAAATAQAAAAADATTKANAAETAAKAYADTLVVGLVDDRGNYDASGNVFPSAGGSGAASAVLKGDLWTVSVAGTLGGVAVTAGDLVRALVDAPGQTAGNWAVTENNIGYVAEPAQTAVSQAEAEAGTGTSVRSWTPLRVFQAIAAKLALGTWISGATGKATPVDADTLPLSDSAASDALKKLTWANLKATLKTYFDTLYAATTVVSARNTVTAVSSTSGVLAALDYALGDYFTLAMTENVTSWAGFSNLPGAGKGCTIMLRITQHASSAKTMAWPSSFKWAGGSAGAISTGLGAVDLLALTTFDNGTTFRVTLAKAFA